MKGMRWLRRRPRPAPPDPSAQTMVEEPGRPPIVEDEYVPPARPPRPNLWPWLLLLLLLVVGGLLAAYFLTRDNDDGNTNKAASAVTVPRVVGLKQNAAVRRLNDSGLTPEILAGRS